MHAAAEGQSRRADPGRPIPEGIESSGIIAEHSGITVCCLQVNDNPIADAGLGAANSHRLLGFAQCHRTGGMKPHALQYKTLQHGGVARKVQGATLIALEPIKQFVKRMHQRMD